MDLIQLTAIDCYAQKIAVGVQSMTALTGIAASIVWRTAGCLLGAHPFLQELLKSWDFLTYR
jgi:hypothetical protein